MTCISGIMPKDSTSSSLSTDCSTSYTRCPSYSLRQFGRLSADLSLRYNAQNHGTSIPPHPGHSASSSSTSYFSTRQAYGTMRHKGRWKEKLLCWTSLAWHTPPPNCSSLHSTSLLYSSRCYLQRSHTRHPFTKIVPTRIPKTYFFLYPTRLCSRPYGRQYLR